MASQEKLYQTLSEKLTPIHLKLFQKLSEEGKFPNSFCEIIITLIPKSNKDTTKKETYRLITLMNIGEKIFSEILAI